MPLRPVAHTAGNTIRYEIDYSDWLDEGVSLTDATVTLDAASAGEADITIGTVAMTPSHRVVFLLTALVLNQTFTLAVQVTDSRNEIKNDTIPFHTIAP